MMEESPDLIAIDIVILPDQELMDESIRLNQLLGMGNAIPLNMNDCVPHITLAMGAVNQANLPAIYTQLERLVHEIKPFIIEVDCLYETVQDHGASLYGIALKYSRVLQELHGNAITILEPYLEIPTEGSVHYVRGVNASTLSYIGKFSEEESGENYFPHITLGFGGLENKEISTLNSTIEGMFIYHLGNYCTCARMLKSFPFKS